MGFCFFWLVSEATDVEVDEEVVDGWTVVSLVVILEVEDTPSGVLVLVGSVEVVAVDGLAAGTSTGVGTGGSVEALGVAVGVAAGVSTVVLEEVSVGIVTGGLLNVPPAPALTVT